MRLSRRQFGMVAGAGTALGYLTGVHPAAGSAFEARPLPEDDALNHHRWITGQRQTVMEPGENCWHPQLARSAKGELLLSVILGWQGRTMLLRSSDEGKTWSKPTLVCRDFDIEGGGGWGLSVLKSGRLLMSYLDISPWTHLPNWPPASEPRRIGMWPDKGLRPWGWRPSTTRMQLRTVYSDDDGQTWKRSDPLNTSPWIGAIPHGSGPIFEVGNTVYMPVWAWFSEEDWGNSALLQSNDGGLTWKPGTVIARGDKLSGVQYREACVQVLPNGEWLAICRANYPNDYAGLVNVSMHTARSRDGGKTWSKPLPTFVALAYPRMQLLPDGGLMAYGAISECLRNFFSYNHGESWAYEDLFYTRDSRQSSGLLDRGSASAVVLDEKRVLVTYYAPKDQSGDWNWVNPINRVESVILQRVPWDAREVIAR